MKSFNLAESSGGVVLAASGSLWNTPQKSAGPLAFQEATRSKQQTHNDHVDT